LKKYLSFDAPGLGALDNVEIGTRVKISVNGNDREVTIKGIVRGKVDEIDRRVFFVDNQLRGLIGRTDYNVDEIMIRLAPGTDPIKIKEAIVATGADKNAKVQTYVEGEPKFVKDIKQTFAILGNLMSSIGLAVASITIFIVIFVNAITRRKYIGILKGVGIDGFAIEVAYIIQSLFYAFLGTAFGLLFIFGFLKPYLDRHPIDFPFSDGILVATFEGTVIRILVLLVATFIAGYIPAKIVVKQNTLDAILGR
jgi:ABC-type lipoprotein release transport system permease subunit